MRFVPGLTVVVVTIASASGCGGSSHGGESQPAETSTTGSLTVDWTVKGAADPNACNAAAATAIEIAVSRQSNEHVGTFQQSCSALSTSIALQAGNYVADAKLLDAAGTPLTKAQSLGAFTIHVKSELTVPVDFAENAFVAPAPAPPLP